MKKLLLIDTFNFLHRAYHALPKTFRDQNGNPTNAIYGVTSMLISTFDQLNPDYVLTALDDVAPTHRVTEFTGYKAHRKPIEDDLSSQIPSVFEIIDAFGVKRVSVPGYEADDIIGTSVKKFSGKNLDVIIVSNDRDMWQLVGEHCMVFNPVNGAAAEWVGVKEVEAKFGFGPESIPEYKGLRGDASDNIPGVYGIGDVTAQKLISEYKTVENLYKNIDKVSPEGIRKKLLEGYEQAIMSRDLARIVTDIPLTMSLEECRYTTFNKGKVKDVLEKYNFKSLIRRLGFDFSDRTKKVKSDAFDAQLNLF